MNKEIGYIKKGSHVGYKIYDHGNYISIWEIGNDSIVISKQIAKSVLEDILELL